MDIDTEDRLKGVTDLIFEKVIFSPVFVFLHPINHEVVQKPSGLIWSEEKFLPCYLQEIKIELNKSYWK